MAWIEMPVSRQRLSVYLDLDSQTPALSNCRIGPEDARVVDWVFCETRLAGLMLEDQRLHIRKWRAGQASRHRIKGH
jgi:hypothetical protein